MGMSWFSSKGKGAYGGLVLKQLGSFQQLAVHADSGLRG